MTIRLYHGSQDEVVEPEYGLGQDHHDFGRGFYLTEIPDPAFNRLERLFSDLIREDR